MEKQKRNSQGSPKKGNWVGDIFQAQEYIDQYDQEALAPGETEGLTRSSAPGQSFQRPDPSQPTTSPDQPNKGKKLTGE